MNTSIKKIETVTGREARIIISEDNWLEDSAIDQFKKTMELPGMCCGVGMPDLHPGKGQPVGAAFITQNCLYPHLVGSDIGCGMGLWQLDLAVRKVKLDRWEKQLFGLDDPWDGDSSQWLAEFGIKTDNPFLSMQHHQLGTIGSGNHFAEFQQVQEIVNSNLFEETGIDKQAVTLLVHSGSRGLGQAILRRYLDRYGAQAITTTTGQSIQDDNYIQGHDYAITWAAVNRELVAERFCQSVRAKRRKLFDMTHNMVKPLSLEQIAAMGLSVHQGEEYWIHRKGASPVDQGFVMIPGSRGSLSYLVKPNLSNYKNLALGGFSLAHGAGRKWKRSDVRGRLEGRYKVKDLESTALGSRVICKTKDLLYEEAPQAYKNINRVISDLVDAGMVDIVATFKPLLTYKTRKR